jgi:hypothetical protein
MFFKFSSLQVPHTPPLQSSRGVTDGLNANQLRVTANTVKDELQAKLAKRFPSNWNLTVSPPTEASSAPRDASGSASASSSDAGAAASPTPSKPEIKFGIRCTLDKIQEPDNCHVQQGVIRYTGENQVETERSGINPSLITVKKDKKLFHYTIPEGTGVNVEKFQKLVFTHDLNSQQWTVKVGDQKQALLGAPKFGKYVKSAPLTPTTLRRFASSSQQPQMKEAHPGARALPAHQFLSTAASLASDPSYKGSEAVCYLQIVVGTTKYTLNTFDPHSGAGEFYISGDQAQSFRAVISERPKGEGLQLTQIKPSDNSSLSQAELNQRFSLQDTHSSPSRGQIQVVSTPIQNQYIVGGVLS